MKPFELRLAKLHSTTAAHVKNLRAFCEDNCRFNRLTLDDRALIIDQLDIMSSLQKVLEARMRRLNIPV